MEIKIRLSRGHLKNLPPQTELGIRCGDAKMMRSAEIIRRDGENLRAVFRAAGIPNKISNPSDLALERESLGGLAGRKINTDIPITRLRLARIEHDRFWRSLRDGTEAVARRRLLIFAHKELNFASRTIARSEHQTPSRRVARYRDLIVDPVARRDIALSRARLRDESGLCMRVLRGTK